ncbi:MAG: hypothetical protein LBU46_02185, partial [Candidatus Accumulibacter sp.]|nr:hypothetical protein [Accumulibacter sp.]
LRCCLRKIERLTRKNIVWPGSMLDIFAKLARQLSKTMLRWQSRVKQERSKKHGVLIFQNWLDKLSI